MSYNPYPPPQQGYNYPPPSSSHPLPPNPNLHQNQGYPPPPAVSQQNYDRPSSSYPPPSNMSVPVPHSAPAPYNAPAYGSVRDDRGSSGPPPGRYGGGGGGGGDRREMSPGRRNQYPQPQGPGFQEDRRDRGPGPGPRDRGFSRDTDRDRDRNRDRDRGGGPSKGSRKDPRSVAERIELERPNRILFVRNISFEAETDRLKLDFEHHGSIQKWHDMIKSRGILLVTYYDLRAAGRAKDALHGIKIGSREIDIHYGLPKEEDLKEKCDRDKSQGSILIILKPHVPINLQEAGRMCDSFGEVKSLRACNSSSQAIVEYWDSRSAVDLFDQMNGKPFEGGTLDLKFIWDEPPPGHAKPERREERGGRRVSETRGGGGSYDREREREYNHGPPPGDRYSDRPPAPPIDDRLDQAKKVQQLLATLGSAPAPQTGGYPYPPPNDSRPPGPGYGPPPTTSYVPPAPVPAPYSNANGGYGNQTPARPPSNYGNGPPPPPPAQPYSIPPPGQYTAPPSNNYPPPSSGYNPIPTPAPIYGGPPPNPAYNPPPAYPPPNNYNAPPSAYQPPPSGYNQPPQLGYDPAAQGYRPAVPIAADPRRPPPQGQGQYRPPGQGQGGGSEVGNLLARLNQNR